MTRSSFLIILLTTVLLNIKGQKILYGVNLDKVYPGIKSEGTKDLSKEIILKDKSVFYSVRISFDDFVFSAVHLGFDPFKNPAKYYKKGLDDIKKVFGNPINIYTDTSFTTTTTDFYLWKIKRDTGYFLIYYSLSGFGLSLNVDKMFDEQYANEHIRDDIYAEQLYRKNFYYLKTKELNMPDWY